MGNIENTFNGKYPISQMTFTMSAFLEIQATVGSERAESGGLLLGSRDDFIVRKYVHDKTGSRGRTNYDPDMEFINETVEYYWQKHGLSFLGFLHSHPRGVSRLSGDYGDGIGDIGYINLIMDAIPGLDRFLAPIVFSSYDKKPFEMFPYVAERGDIDNYYETPDGIRIIKSSKIKKLTPYKKTEEIHDDENVVHWKGKKYPRKSMKEGAKENHRYSTGEKRLGDYSQEIKKGTNVYQEFDDGSGEEKTHKWYEHLMQQNPNTIKGKWTSDFLNNLGDEKDEE